MLRSNIFEKHRLFRTNKVDDIRPRKKTHCASGHTQYLFVLRTVHRILKMIADHFKNVCFFGRRVSAI